MPKSRPNVFTYVIVRFGLLSCRVARAVRWLDGGDLSVILATDGVDNRGQHSKQCPDSNGKNEH
ncbi:MAG: hypothetical protein QM784_04540 [Polyangiaceae bacterium]